VTRDHEAWQLVIGGLQGPRRHVSHEVIKQATRACYGLFPKRLLLEFIWLLAARSHIAAIYGVSDNGHVFRALRYRLSKGAISTPATTSSGSPSTASRKAPGAGGYRCVWKENRWRVSPVKNGPNTGVDSSCWISWRSRWQY
jgi:hypothetical protein